MPGVDGSPLARDYAALAARVHAAVQPSLALRVYGEQVSPDGAERYPLLLVDVPAARGRGHYRVLLNGGTHGDEPAGAEAVVSFLEERRYERWPEVSFTVLPCTNPWGYAHDRREGPGGRDLNRSFRRAARATPEVALLKRALGRRTFDLFLDCHEDVDAPGLYVFAPGALGRAIVEAVKPLGPVHPGPAVDGEIPLKDSVVTLDDPERRPRQRLRRDWPLPFYVARYHQRRPRTPAETENARPPDVLALSGATIETPTMLPLDQRVAMHHAALDAALETLNR